MAKSHFSRLLVFLLVSITAAFFVLAIAVQRASSEVDSFSNGIVHNSSPSIERLAALRGSTVEVELALSRYVTANEATAPQLRTALTRTHAALKKEIEDYLRLPVFPDEQRHWNEVQQAWARFDESSKRTRELVEAGDERYARVWFTGVVQPNAAHLLDATMRAIEFNAEKGTALASKIKEARRHITFLTYCLASSCVFLGLAGSLLVHLRARSQRAADRANSELLEVRSAELEQFAGRVAHDIRGPLSTARMAGELCLMRSADDGVRELVSRIIRSLSRADAITTGLLEFARAGARPDPGARTDVRAALADLYGAMTTEAERARIAVSFEPAPPVFVACSVGVYLSLVSNLVRNAIKYMGDSAVRRVVVTVSERQSMVRTEVRDTGPGIHEADQASLFELYFRGHQQRAQGFGLGLATVKKLVDGHHGSVGVSSALGKGSTFWFELPKAGVLHALGDDNVPVTSPAASSAPL